MSYIEFIKVTGNPNRKLYEVTSKKSGEKLGLIRWQGSWKKYVFAPDKNTYWDEGCLKDVVQFLERLNEKKGIKNAKD